MQYVREFWSLRVGLEASISEVEDLVCLQKRFGLSYCSWLSLSTGARTIVGGDLQKLRGGRWTASETKGVPTVFA